MSDTPIPVWMKLEVLERDGWNCLRCGIACRRYPGRTVRPDTLTFDHIVPERLRGMTTVENLQVLCAGCNRWKGIRIIDFRRRPEPAVVYDREPLSNWAVTVWVIWTAMWLGAAVLTSVYFSSAGVVGGTLGAALGTWSLGFTFLPLPTLRPAADHAVTRHEGAGS